MLRLVVQNPLNLLHDIVGQLGQNIQCLQVFRDLLGLGSTQDARRDVRVLERPCDGETGHRATERLGDLGELLDLGDLGLALLGLKLLDGFSEEFLVGGVTGVFWDAVVVLPKSGRDRRRVRGHRSVIARHHRGS